MQKSLEGIRVIELGEYISAPYCGKMMAAFGAEVIKVEPPGGDPARSAGPFPANLPHPEKSALFLYLNTVKKSITLNPETGTGMKIMYELIRQADVLVENPPPCPPPGLDAASLEDLNPRLIITSITGFGTGGPYRDYLSPASVSYSVSGHTYINGAPEREPLQGPGPQPDYQGGLHGFFGTMAALFEREESGRGQRVEVSINEVMAGLHQFTITNYTYGGQVKRRTGNRYDSDYPTGIYPCKDGYVSLSAPGDFQREMLYLLMGKPELAEDPRFRTPQDRVANADEFDSILVPWLQGWTKTDLFHACGELRVSCAPVTHPGELLEDPQFRARGFWAEVDHPEAGRLPYPGAPFRMSETPWQAGRAPLLGEHNEEIYCQRLGYTKKDLVRLRQIGIV